MYEWLHDYLKKAKMNVFRKNFVTLQPAPLESLFSKKFPLLNVDFSLWGKQQLDFPKIELISDS